MRRADRSADLFTGSMEATLYPIPSTKVVASGFSGTLGGHGLPEHLEKGLKVAALGADVADRDAEGIAARDERVRDEVAAVFVDPREDSRVRRVALLG